MGPNQTSVLESPEVWLIATGFGFTEGPLWEPSGSLLFVDIVASSLLRWEPSKGVTVVREGTDRGNGITHDLDGRLLMCEGFGRRLSRTDRTGAVSTVVDAWNGKRFNRPNDVVCRSDGMVFFTDPVFGVPAEERGVPFPAVYRVTPDGDLRLATDALPYPNGLAFSPDERTLYVANTRGDERCDLERDRGEVCTHRYLAAFDVGPDGSLSNHRIFADMTSDAKGSPDGLKVDVEGRVYCTGPGGTWVLDPRGALLETIRTPYTAANLAFGGADGRTLFLTARKSVYSVRTRTRGLGACTRPAGTG